MKVKPAFLVLSAAMLAGAAWLSRSADAASETGSSGQPPTQAAASTAGLSRQAVFRQVAALAELGKVVFNDTAMSGSGRLACSSCHDPANHFAPSNALPVQLGGLDLKQAGTRATPTLTYKQATPQFTEHFFDSEDEGDESVDNGPTGGLTWDGRVDRGRDQALIPLLSPFEMANVDRSALAASAEKRYGARLRSIVGETALVGPEAALEGVVKALEAYQQDYKTFYPYSSKFDAYLTGQTKLTASEANGLKLFEDETKGNCSSCHISQVARDGTPPQFTDYGLLGLAVPRNPAIAANNDSKFFDLGLCGPERTDFHDRSEYCGLFKTPTLRNVATRQTFFHNGAMHSLRDAVRFYAERDTRPEKWYPLQANGTVDIYNDIPPALRENINRDPPFGQAGDTPPLTDSEIDDIVAFLGTLTDGYKPAN